MDIFRGGMRGRKPPPGVNGAQSRHWKTLVVDATAPARRTLVTMLGQYAQIDVVGECDDAVAAVAAVRDLQPDLVFVDAQMPEATSLDAVPADDFVAAPIVVFTTAHADHALRGVEAHAFHYLLKPFSDERLAHTMARVLWALERSNPVAFSTRPRALTVRETGGPLVVPVDQIDWIEADDYCTRIHSGRRRPLVRSSLQSLLEELGGDGFMRAHRSSIINITRVRDVRSRPSGDAEALLASGERVEVGRSYRPQLENRVRTEQARVAGR